MDIQGLDYQFRDGGGGFGFGGTAHTGTMEWSGLAAVFSDTRIGASGRFGPLTSVTQTVEIDDVTGSFTFDSGLLTGGSLTISLDNPESDSYTATVKAGSGQLLGSSLVGFTLDGLTFDGAFSDDQWGDIDVAPFFAAQTAPGALEGSFFQFRFRPDGNAAGNGDAEVFVVVPLPPAAWGGLATLAGLAGCSLVRRR